MVISAENNNFNPSCDVIIGAVAFNRLESILKFGRDLPKVLYGALVIAFLYNSIGLYFAVTGQLSPVVAAILMPLSSLTVMLYGVLVSSVVWRLGK
jgi:Cu+-exporting ATPase